MLDTIRGAVTSLAAVLVGAVLASAALVPTAAAGGGSRPAQLCKAGETLLFGFEMAKSAKFVAFCTNKQDDYIVYRFGTSAKTELEYPAERKGSWKQFTHVHFGEECDRKGKGDYLVFTIGETAYSVRERCFFNDRVADDKNADTDAYQVDIEIKNTKSGKTTVLMGDEQSRAGTLALVDARIPAREL